MPKTIIKLIPLEAAVFYANGNTCTKPCCTEQDANAWIDNMMYKYGNNIVACDIYPAMTTQIEGN